MTYLVEEELGLGLPQDLCQGLANLEFAAWVTCGDVVYTSSAFGVPWGVPVMKFSMLNYGRDSCAFYAQSRWSYSRHPTSQACAAQHKLFAMFVNKLDTVDLEKAGHGELRP